MFSFIGTTTLSGFEAAYCEITQQEGNYLNSSSSTYLTMEKIFVLTSKIFPSNPTVGSIGSIDLNLRYLQWFGVPLFGVERKTQIYKILIFTYGLLILTLFRFPYYCFEMYDIATCWRNLNALTQNMCVSMMHLSGAIKLFFVLRRLEDLNKINRQFEYMTKRYVKSQKQIDTFYLNELENKLSFIVYTSMILMTTIFMMFVLFFNAADVGNTFPYRARLPENVPLMAKVIYMPVAIVFIAGQTAGLDYLNVTYINLTRCQLQILNTAFDELNESVVGQVTVDPLKYLNGLIEHHTFILDIRQQIERVFKYPMLVQFFASLFMFAMAGFQAMVRQDTSGLAMTYVFVACILAELFLYCWYGNEVSEQNKTLASRGYETTWYTFDVKFRKTLLIFLLNAQQPFHFTAGGYAVLNLLTFSSILSKSYTYVAVLRQQYAGK